MIIYQIKNLVNNKIYIGKTNNFERRYKEHFSESYRNRESNKVLYQAFQKYGKENFEMSVLECCNDAIWPEREQFWIEHKKTMVPTGYNMVPGGGEPPHIKGENHHFAVLSQIQANAVIKLLQTYSVNELSNADIAIAFDICVDQIRRINNGEVWIDSTIQYPIRQYGAKQDLPEIYQLLESWQYTCEEIGAMFGKTKSCIKAINNGQNYYDPNRVYPIKPPKIFYPKSVFYEAKHLITEGKTNSEITKLTGMQIKTLNNLREGKYDKYLTCND